ncbi:MAG: type II secretion system GspH family protein [Phycisphaerales bacterium]|nr:type II secretion system GspH family protein [Phycisphaerales bacterium]
MNRKKHAFTLLELLIVVTILGIIAATVGVQIGKAGNDARDNTIKSTLQTLRSQIELFKFHHNGQAPDLGNNDAQYWVIMLGKSNTSDIVNPVATGIYGPYLRAAPANPVNRLTTLGAAPNPNVGWVYSSTDGSIKAVSTNGTTCIAY